MSFINSFLFVSLSLIPKIALEGFGFVFFFLIQLGSIANSDTNRITFGRFLCLVMRVARRQTHWSLFSCSAVCCLPSYSSSSFLVDCKHIWKNIYLKKKHIKKKKRNKEGGVKLRAILILNFFSIFVTTLVSQCSNVGWMCISSTLFSWMMW